MSSTPATCAHLGCARPVYSHRICWGHWQRLLGPLAIPPTKPLRPPPRGPLTRDELVAEVEHLLGTDHPGKIAARLGYQPLSLARRLTRCGRRDLARRFDRVESKAVAA